MTESVNKTFKNHLDFANQSYFEHFSHSMVYCGRSLKSAFYFFCHSIIPDIFIFDGSESVKKLNDDLCSKYIKRMREINGEDDL